MALFFQHPLAAGMEEITELQKSPQLEGVIEGSKAAIIAAPIVAAIQALRGRSPLAGAVVGGVGVGTAAGLLAATKQKYENLRREADIRYYLQNIADRDAAAGQVHPALSGGSFQRGFTNVRNSY